MAFIYKITNDINNKVYIGKTEKLLNSVLNSIAEKVIFLAQMDALYMQQ